MQVSYLQGLASWSLLKTTSPVLGSCSSSGLRAATDWILWRSLSGVKSKETGSGWKEGILQ